MATYRRTSTAASCSTHSNNAQNQLILTALAALKKVEDLVSRD